MAIIQSLNKREDYSQVRIFKPYLFRVKFTAVVALFALTATKQITENLKLPIKSYDLGKIQPLKSCKTAFCSPLIALKKQTKP